MAYATVEIRGKETVSPAARSASDSLGRMGADSDKVFKGIMVTAGDVVGAIKSISSQVGSVFTEYAESQKAMLTFNATVAQSDKLSAGAADRLAMFANRMSMLTGEDDDAVLSMESFLVTSGRTEEEIQKVITAAADMSVVTGKDLRTSVEELNKTFSGSEGRIGSMIVELKDLSDEELRAGAGVDIIAERYKGLAQELSGSASVAIGNLKTQLGNMKEALGEALAPDIIPILQKITDWVIEATPGISQMIAWIKEFGPAIAAVVASYWAYENAANAVKIAQLAMNTALSMNPIGLVVAALVGGAILIATHWEEIKAAFQAGLEALKPIIEAVANAWDNVIAFWKATWDRLVASVKYRIDQITAFFAPLVDGVKTAWDTVVASWTAIWDKLKNAVSEKVDAIKAFFQPLVDVVRTVVSGIDKAISYLPGGRKPGETTYTGQAHANGTDSAAPGLALVGERGPELVVFKGGERVIPNHLLGNIRGLRGYADGVGFDLVGAASGLGSGIIEAVVGFAEGLGSLISSLSIVKALLDPISTILSAAMQVLEPLVKTVLAPLMGILNVLGYTLGKILAPVFSALGPVIKFIGEAFVRLYNSAIMPFANVMITIGNMIYNVMVGFVNAISDLIKWVTFGAVNLGKTEYKRLESGHLETISLADLTGAGMTSGGAATAGGAANYKGPTIVNNYFTINTAALVGQDGFDEFALMVIRRVNSLGLLGRA